MASKADASATAPHVDNSTSPPPASIQTAAVDDEHGAALELDTLAPSTASHVGNSTPPPSSVITQDGAALAQDQPPSVNRQQAPRGTNNDGNTKQAREAERAKQIDLVDDYFLSSKQPGIALFAISICLVGVMDLLPQQRHDPAMWKDKVESVSSFYGPGVVISWCISGMSMLYDANQAAQSGVVFQYLKYLALGLTGAFAVCDAVWRALRSDFGPSYAAALYMSDKGFELATLLYTVYNFPVHREGSAATDQPEVEQPSNSRRAKAVRTIERYKIWPCAAMVSMWGYSRALANQHIVYNIHAQNPKGVDVEWGPVLSSQYWKLGVPLVCFGLTCTLSVLTRWGLKAWGLPMGILSSFAALHSGFFGTFTPLKLTACSMLDFDQITPIVLTIVVLVVQYTKESGAVGKMWERVGKVFRTTSETAEANAQTAGM